MAHDKALEETFILPVAVAGLALFASFGMERRSIIGKEIEIGAAEGRS